jgi:hypothetical protein
MLPSTLLLLSLLLTTAAHQCCLLILPLLHRDYTKFAAAVAWLSEYSGRSCRLAIPAASCSLSGLSCDSRKYLQQLLA